METFWDPEALLAALDLAEVRPASQLFMIPSCRRVWFIVVIKVFHQGPIRDIPIVTVFNLSIDVKYVIILLKLGPQG